MRVKDIISDFRVRTHNASELSWIKYIALSTLIALFIIWSRLYFCILLFPLTFDFYITRYIFSTAATTEIQRFSAVKQWTKAVVWALLITYVTITLIGQTFIIPSESMEKSLMTGDIIWVDKTCLGPRLPNTPINIPIFHNRIPIIGTDSYSHWPELGYKRLSGWGKLEPNDIIVFNLPVGDTVATKYVNTPYHYDALVYDYGWKTVNTNKAEFGEIKYRPIDRREHYIKRIVGMPGQTMRIVNDTVYADNITIPYPGKAQHRYIIALKEPLTRDILEHLDINQEECVQIGYSDIGEMGIATGIAITDFIYDVLLTDELVDLIRQAPTFSVAIKLIALDNQAPTALFPRELSRGWSCANWGGARGISIPKRGMEIPMTVENWYTYQRCIRNYEHHTSAHMSNDTVYIDGEPVKSYTFAMNYFFVLGDNRYNSEDSRYWGFVPEDHIVGKPVLVFTSIDGEHNRIRWNRTLKKP